MSGRIGGNYIAGSKGRIVRRPDGRTETKDAESEGQLLPLQIQKTVIKSSGEREITFTVPGVLYLEDMAAIQKERYLVSLPPRDEI